MGKIDRLLSAWSSARAARQASQALVSSQPPAWTPEVLVGAQNEVLAEVPERLTGFEEVQLTLVSWRRAGLDAPASTTTRTGRSARAGRVVTGMVAGRGGAVGATIARRAGGARARPCTQKAIDLPYWLPRCPAGSVYTMVRLYRTD